MHLMRASAFGILVLLSACFSSPPQRLTEVSLVPVLGNFTEFWSICGSAHAMTQDKRWLVSVKYPKSSGALAVSPGSEYAVDLVDFREVRDLGAAVSLYQNNDIVLENNEPLVVRGVSGQSQFRIRTMRRNRESTVSISLQSVVFPHPSGEVRLTSAVFPVLKVNPWCPG